MSAHCHVCWHAFQLGDKAYAAVAENGNQFVLLCEREVLCIPPAARQKTRVDHGVSIHMVIAQYQPDNPVSLDRLMILGTVKLGRWLFGVSRSAFVSSLTEQALPPLPGR